MMHLRCVEVSAMSHRASGVEVIESLLECPRFPFMRASYLRFCAFLLENGALTSIPHHPHMTTRRILCDFLINMSVML